MMCVSYCTDSTDLLVAAGINDSIVVAAATADAAAVIWQSIIPAVAVNFC